MATRGFGIIGCGIIAEFHTRAIREIEGARVVATFDVVPGRAAKIAKLAGEGCRVYDDMDRMLADPRVDVICVCTPSGAHRDPSIAAANAGKHVVVEKPLEITLPRCDAIIGASDANGVRLCAIFPSRFSAANVALKQAIEAGRFGRLTLGDTYVKWWRTQEYYDSSGWRGTWQLDGGGALMNQAIHNVDLIQWLMGDVKSIQAMTGRLAHERIEVEDTAVATLRFKNGALGVIEATTSAYPRPVEADRGSRRPRLGPRRAGRHHPLGLCREAPGRRGAGLAQGDPQRRRRRPQGHQPRRTPRPTHRLPPRHRLGGQPTR